MRHYKILPSLIALVVVLGTPFSASAIEGMSTLERECRMALEGTSPPTTTPERPLSLLGTQEKTFTIGTGRGDKSNLKTVADVRVISCSQAATMPEFASLFPRRPNKEVPDGHTGSYSYSSKGVDYTTTLVAEGGYANPPIRYMDQVVGYGFTHQVRIRQIDTTTGRELRSDPWSGPTANLGSAMSAEINPCLREIDRLDWAQAPDGFLDRLQTGE